MTSRQGGSPLYTATVPGVTLWAEIGFPARQSRWGDKYTPIFPEEAVEGDEEYYTTWAGHDPVWNRKGPGMPGSPFPCRRRVATVPQPVPEVVVPRVPVVAPRANKVLVAQTAFSDLREGLQNILSDITNDEDQGEGYADPFEIQCWKIRHARAALEAVAQPDTVREDEVVVSRSTMEFLGLLLMQGAKVEWDPAIIMVDEMNAMARKAKADVVAAGFPLKVTNV